jgi:hypothetical protein
LEKSTKTKKKSGRSPDTDEESSPDDEDSDEEVPQAVVKKGRPTKKSRVEAEVVEDDVEPAEDEVEILSGEEPEEVRSHNIILVFK